MGKPRPTKRELAAMGHHLADLIETKARDIRARPSSDLGMGGHGSTRPRKLFCAPDCEECLEFMGG